MLFNSLSFLIFLPIVFGIYWFACRSVRKQNLLLIVASFVFYGWLDWRFCGLLALSVATAYGCGWWIARGRWIRGGNVGEDLNHGIHGTHGRGRLPVVVALVINLGILGFFKYYNFFANSISSMFQTVGWGCDLPTLALVLPIGISFYSFMSIAYVIDVYRGTCPHAKDPIAFVACMTFFPQLLAGPIGRASVLLPQFEGQGQFSDSRNRILDSSRAIHGLSLIVYGLFKKMVVADTLCLYVDNVFFEPALYSALTCFLGAIFFTIQIYCDFSGYSDTARGVAKLFGIDLMLNFDRPYLAKTFGDFWRRWHISLSTWFRDYLYIPLGGNRVSFPRLIANTWVVFLLSGLWHGASWTFVAWGGLHALFLTGGLVRKRLLNGGGRAGRVPLPTQGGDGVGVLEKLKYVSSVLIVFIGVALAWICFRAPTFSALWNYLVRMFTGTWKSSMMQVCAGMGPLHFLMCLMAAGLLVLSYAAPRDAAFRTTRGHVVFILLCLVAIVFLGAPCGGEFIYFKF